MAHKECFVNAHCCTSDCPNMQRDEFDERYGFGIADDIDIKPQKCKSCMYNTGTCGDCLFLNMPECPERSTKK